MLAKSSFGSQNLPDDDLFCSVEYHFFRQKSSLAYFRQIGDV